MRLNITARHLDLTPALSDYVHRKVEKAQRYFDPIVWVQVILSVEKLRHIAEIVVHTPGNTFRTKGIAGDLYSAIDLSTHKLDLYLSRVKEKQKNHHVKINPKDLNFLSGHDSKQQNVSKNYFSETIPLEQPSSIVEVNKVFLRPQSLTQAIKGLNSNGLSFLLFINERTNQLSVVYKKGKGEYGLMEVEE